MVPGGRQRHPYITSRGQPASATTDGRSVASWHRGTHRPTHPSPALRALHTSPSISGWHTDYRDAEGRGPDSSYAGDELSPILRDSRPVTVTILPDSVETLRPWRHAFTCSGPVLSHWKQLC